MKLPLLCILCFVVSTGLCSNVDSLMNKLQTAQGAEKVKVLNELFRAFINSEPIKAVGYTREALLLAEEVGDEKGQAACYNNLGIAYRNQGALDVALGNYLHSLEIYTKLQNAEGIASTKNNIATIHAMKKDYAQALNFFEESHQGFVALQSTDQIIGSMNNLGNLHSDLQLYDKALSYYTDAYKIAEKTGKEFADPLVNVGNLYYRQGNYQRAVEYYRRALVIVRKQNDRNAEMAIMANLGELYEKAAQPKQAQVYLDSALTIAAELEAHYLVPQILKSMAANYARQGKHKDAYEAFQKYDAAREKVYGEESSRRVAQMDVAMQLHETASQLESLKLSDQNKTLRLRNAQFIIIAGVLALIAGIAAFNLIFFRRTKQKTPRMNRDEARTLLASMTKSASLLRHMRTVELVMEAYAGKMGQDPDTWAIAGLLHDADYEAFPDKHPNIIVAKLLEAGEEAIAHAVSAHYTKWGVPYETPLDKALLATDELTGFIVACAQVRPEGISTLEPKSVIKKLKDKGFAAKVDREEVFKGVELMGVELAAHIEFIIGVLKENKAELGI